MNINEIENPKPAFKDGGVVFGSTENIDHGGEVVVPLSVLQKIKAINEFLGRQTPISDQISIMSGKGSYAEHLRNQG